MFKRILLIILFLFPFSAEAYYLPNVEFRAFLPGTNLPVVNGFVYFYLAGTLQLQTVYSDSLCSVPLPNPVSLNTNGQPTTASGSVTAICANSALDIQIFDSGMNLIDSSMKNVSFQPLQTILSSEWIPVTGIPVYVSATQFTMTGNRTALFTVGRRVQIVITGGTIYGSVVSSSYGSGSTTVTVSFDSGSMNSGLSAVSVGLLNAVNESMPSIINEPLISFSASTQTNFTGPQVFTGTSTFNQTITGNSTFNLTAGGNFTFNGNINGNPIFTGNPILNGTAGFLETNIGSGSTGYDNCVGHSPTHQLECNYNSVGFFPIPQTIASGTFTMGTTSINVEVCLTENTIANVNFLATDSVIINSETVDTTANHGALSYNAVAAAGNVYIVVCNANTGSNRAPSANTWNYRVIR